MEYKINDRKLAASTFIPFVNQIWQGDYDMERTQTALSKTLNITAYDKKRLVGCLRILTDGYFFGTITELLVLPEYQKQGVGSKLLELAKENTPTILYFGAQPGIEAFYEKNRIFVLCIVFFVQIAYNITTSRKGDDRMAGSTTNISIRMDSDLKAQADALFNELGMNISTAFNIFVRQSLREGRIPFDISLNQPNKETIAAMLEAERIAKDPSVKGYTNLDELFADLEK